MKHPILFSSDMVRAILQGNKTQTRRVVTPQPWQVKYPDGREYIASELLGYLKVENDGTSYWKFIERFPSPSDGNPHVAMRKNRYGKIGDHLWVRETFAKYSNGFVYKADFNVSDGFGSDVVDLKSGKTDPLVWKPSIHMPREASRITLEIVNVRVEQIQSITAKDALSEGICDDAYSRHPKSIADEMTISKFVRLWNTINGNRGFGWDVNPWVWVIEFRKINSLPEPKETEGAE